MYAIHTYTHTHTHTINTHRLYTHTQPAPLAIDLCKSASLIITFDPILLRVYLSVMNYFFIIFKLLVFGVIMISA